MVRTPVWPLAGVVLALGLAGCAASPLYVSSPHRGTVGEIPRDGNGEPMWGSIPRPVAAPLSPYIPPAPGIPITGPGVAEMRVAPPAPAYVSPAPVPITGPGVADQRVAPLPRSPIAASASTAVAPPLYAASPRSAYVLSPLSPLSPDASPSEVRKRKRDRRRECAHYRDCPPDIRP